MSEALLKRKKVVACGCMWETAPRLVERQAEKQGRHDDDGIMNKPDAPVVDNLFDRGC